MIYSPMIMTSQTHGQSENKRGWSSFEISLFFVRSYLI